jgi:hypothetical protein
MHSANMLSEKTYVCPDSPTPRCTALNTSVGSKPPIGEALPQFTEVLASGEDLICLNDGIASIEERGTTLLELHAIQYEPNYEQLDLSDGNAIRSATYWTVRELPCLGMRGFLSPVAVYSAGL